MLVPPPLQMWACYNAHRICTTNACEAFYRHLNNMFYHAHPDIFSSSDALLEVQDISYSKMKNKPATSLNPKDLIIQTYMTKLEQHEITRFDFVYDLSRKFLPPKIKK